MFFILNHIIKIQKIWNAIFMGQVIRFFFNVLFFLLLTNNSYSKNFSEISNYSGETSDRIKVSSSQLILEKNKSDIYWPYTEASESKYSYGLKYSHYGLSGPLLGFTSNSLRIAANKIIDKSQKLLVNLGVQNLKHVIDRNYMIGGIEYQNQWSSHFNFDITIDRQFLFPSVVPLNNDPFKLYSTMTQLVFNWNFCEYLDLQIKNRYNFIDDNNQSHYNDIQLMYAFMRYPHWIRLGMGGELFGYQRNTSSYWSPKQFSNWGPRLDVSYSIYDNFQYFIGGSYNFFRENDFTPGQGFYGRTGLQWGDRNHLLFVLAYEKTQSIQSGRIWHNDAFNIIVNGFW
jgi:hypothetical protein